MGYTEAVLEVLKRDFRANIILIHWDDKKVSQHEISLVCDREIKRSSIDRNGLTGIVKDFKPDLIYISGWMDTMYLSVVKKAKSLGIPVVAGMDTPWTGSVKQHISSLFLKKYWTDHFSYLWIPGQRQYEYATRLGFKDKCLKNLYSGRVSLFQKSWESSETYKKEKYPHHLLFIGRLIERKGIDILIRQFKNIKNITKSDWQLTIAGSGPLENLNSNSHDIHFTGYKNQNELAKLMESCGAFCLPSRWEPWGVVVHECAAAGLPLLLSDKCGSAEAFLEEDQNGFLFRSGDERDLQEKLERLMKLSDNTLYMMGRKSYCLSHKITPEISAQSLISILK
jgi:glycosyltransferase involved in cell wall biosynthesis